MQGNNSQHTNQVRLAAQETAVTDSSKGGGYFVYIFFKSLTCSNRSVVLKVRVLLITIALFTE